MEERHTGRGLPVPSFSPFVRFSLLSCKMTLLPFQPACTQIMPMVGIVVFDKCAACGNDDNVILRMIGSCSKADCQVKNLLVFMLLDLLLVFCCLRQLLRIVNNINRTNNNNDAVDNFGAHRN